MFFAVLLLLFTRDLKIMRREASSLFAINNINNGGYVLFEKRYGSRRALSDCITKTLLILENFV